jgi:agmatine deiminase
VSAFRVPGETARHERTLIGWPTAARRAALWDDTLEAARAVHRAVAEAVGAHEPVTLVVDPADVESARSANLPGVEQVVATIDDSWLRDTGPIIAVDPGGHRRARHFRFNAWGRKYSPYDADATIGARLAEHLRLPVDEVPMVLEGGSVAVDGAGTLVTTERCLLNPNRNPELDRDGIERVLREAFGVERVVWLADAIAEDDETDGHVDNVVAFSAPGRAVLQGCDDARNPNHAIARENRARLEAAGIEVVEVPVLPYTEVSSRRVVVPYVNYYVANGVVVVPVTGHAADAEMAAIIAAEYPGREIVAVPGAVLAYGGGGVHCITQPVPAATP